MEQVPWRGKGLASMRGGRWWRKEQEDEYGANNVYTHVCKCKNDAC
jgi:hypothetical protein